MPACRLKSNLFKTILAAAIIASPAFAQEDPPAKVPTLRTTEVHGQASLEIVDLTPRFLDFYDAASRPGVDPDARWKLWQEKYGFAAAPPTPEGEAYARELLDAAWPKYPGAMDVIRRGAEGLDPSAGVVFADVADLLDLDQPSKIQVIAYVGAFEGNAFTAGQDGVPFVAIPVEMSPEKRQVTFRHEMTHAIHMLTAGLSGGWERTIAETIFQEGLAMHASKALVPGRDDRAYIEHEEGWFDKAMAKGPEVLEGVLPALEKSDSDTVYKFTMGVGPAGLHREAYVAGWLVIGELLRQGRTFPEIARIPSSEMPDVIRRTVFELLERDE